MQNKNQQHFLLSVLLVDCEKFGLLMPCSEKRRRARLEPPVDIPRTTHKGITSFPKNKANG